MPGEEDNPPPPAAAAAAPAATMSFTPPVITANMMPVPNPSVEKQSAEDWFKIFTSVADNLIAIYRTANQEVVGQRQALATIPSLLNRNESEQRLSTRILQECKTVKEAEALVKKTVGNLENKCQAPGIRGSVQHETGSSFPGRLLRSTD